MAKQKFQIGDLLEFANPMNHEKDLLFMVCDCDKMGGIMKMVTHAKTENFGISFKFDLYPYVRFTEKEMKHFSPNN